MCRKNLVPAAGLIGLGTGILAGLAFESPLVMLVVGTAAISVGLRLLLGR